MSQQLAEFAINDRSMMIALYNVAPSQCVIKIKSVAVRLTDDWHFLLQSEVLLHPLSLRL